MAVRFCHGSPICEVCGASHQDGHIQNCPCPLSRPYRQSERTRLLAEIEVNEPSLLEQAKAYSLAVLRWTAAGQPKREPVEIEHILVICRSCEFYTETDRPRCQKCGCSVNNSPDGLKNKIAMATENCPLDDPKW